MSTTGVSGNALSATRPASGLVALESLYQRTPSHSPTSSRRCSTPLNERIASPIAWSESPAMRPTAAAARAFSRLWRPGSGIGGTGRCSSNHTTCPSDRAAGARVDDVDISKDRVVVAPERQVHARGHLREHVAELGFALLVDDAHRLTLRGEIPGQRDAAAGRAYHEGGHVISRATPAAASAETSPAPQNVSAMRFSDQPWWWNV